MAVAVDECAQCGVAVEGGASDAGACGDGGEGDGLAGAGEFGACLLGPGGAVWAGHPACVPYSARTVASNSISGGIRYQSCRNSTNADVDAEHVRQDRGGQVGGKLEQRDRP